MLKRLQHRTHTHTHTYNQENAYSGLLSLWQQQVDCLQQCFGCENTCGKICGNWHKTIDEIIDQQNTMRLKLIVQ